MSLNPDSALDNEGWLLFLHLKIGVIFFAASFIFYFKNRKNALIRWMSIVAIALNLSMTSYFLYLRSVGKMPTRIEYILE